MRLRRDCGISVEIDGRAGLFYRDGDRRLRIDSEMLAGGEYDLVVYRDSIRFWDPPFDGEPLSEMDRDRIVENVTKELKRFRIDWQ